MALGAESFRLFEEDGAGVIVVEVRETAVTTEGDGRIVTLSLMALQVGGHDWFRVPECRLFGSWRGGDFASPPVHKMRGRMGHPNVLGCVRGKHSQVSYCSVRRAGYGG